MNKEDQVSNNPKANIMKPNTTEQTVQTTGAQADANPPINKLAATHDRYLPFDIRAEFCEPPADQPKYETIDQEIEATFASDEDTIRFLRRLRISLDDAFANVLEEFDDETDTVFRLRERNHPNAAGKYRDLALRLDQVTTYLNEL